jgi:hypothetical protein
MSKVYILGAGASRFAGFPLGADLRPFLEAEEDSNCVQLMNDVQTCWPFVKRVHCLLEKHRHPDLEMILTIANLAIASGGCVGSIDLSEFDIPEVKRAFARLVSSAFVGHAVKLHKPDAEIQRVMQIWGKLVKEGDTVITFNWDPLHEMALWAASDDKWHYSSGYGFRPRNVEEGQVVPSKVKVLKLHGSANWGLRGRGDHGPPEVDYISHLFPEDGHLPESSGSSDFGESLILPSYFKAPTEEPVLVETWEQAVSALRSANEAVILGYSLPEADSPTRTLLSVALSGNEELKNSKLEKSIQVVAGPQHGSVSAYDRWDHLFSVLGCREKVRMVHENFEKFVLSEVAKSLAHSQPDCKPQ